MYNKGGVQLDGEDYEEGKYEGESGREHGLLSGPRQKPELRGQVLVTDTSSYFPMVNSRIYILPSASVSLCGVLLIITHEWQSPKLRLQCRLYSTSCHRPRQVEMLTRCADASRGSLHFPVAETLLQGAVLQPYIHNCQVIVYEGRHTYQYCVFFK